MVNDPVSPLDPRLLDALRAERAAPDEARLRVRARLEAIVPEMRRSNGGGGGGAGTAGALGAYTSAVTAFVIGGVTGAALLAAIAGSRPPRIVYVDRVSPAATTVVAAPAAAPAVAIPSATVAVTAPRPPSVYAASGSGVSRFAAERLLLDEARADLLQGEPARAVNRLELHRKRFPEGLLVEERDAMRVEALVQSARYDEARALAANFRARSPDSLFAATVDSAIAKIP